MTDFLYHFVFHLNTGKIKTSDFIIEVINIMREFLSDLFDEDIPGLNINSNDKPGTHFVEFTCKSKELNENIPRRIEKVFKDNFHVTEIGFMEDKSL